MKDAENCWDFWKCKIKKKCPAFKSDSGRECWIVAGSICENPVCSRLKRGTIECVECKWFKKLNPDIE